VVLAVASSLHLMLDYIALVKSLHLKEITSDILYMLFYIEQRFF